MKMDRSRHSGVKNTARTAISHNHVTVLTILINDVIAIVHFFLLRTSYRRAVHMVGVTKISAVDLRCVDLAGLMGS
jgi:hypothetical protein